jgi:protein subunit release factor B
MMISLSKLERQRKKEKERRKKEKNPKVYSSEEKERKESRETRAENFKLFGVLSSRVEISMEEKKIPKPPRSGGARAGWQWWPRQARVWCCPSFLPLLARGFLW